MNEETLKQIKSTVSQFNTEMQSNSVTDFVVWLDCKLEQLQEQKREENKMRRRR